MAEGFNFGAIFGESSPAYQLFVWQVLASVVQAVGAPGLTALIQLVNSHVPINALSVADAVDAALKGHVSADAAAAEASLSGISRQRFDILLAAAGAPPGPQAMAEALRRGLIPATGAGADVVSYEAGIKEGRMANKYADLVRQLATQWPTPTDALQAVLQGQVDDATGLDLYTKFGGDPQFYQLLFDTRGSAPTPLEAIQMAQRGIIPWDGTGPDAVSFQQAFLEGPWRNKWLEPYRALGEYIPPPRTISAMVAAGSITDEQAVTWWKKTGMTDATAAAFLEDAHHTKQAATRDLAKGDVLTLYKARIIDVKTATEMLSLLKYTAEDSAFELQYADFQVEQGQVAKIITRLHNLYVAHKITDQSATTGMDAAGIPAAQRDQLLSDWKLEQAVNVATLTAAEICDGVKYQLITVDSALTALQQLGYSPLDAWLRLGVALHGPPTDTPPQ